MNRDQVLRRLDSLERELSQLRRRIQSSEANEWRAVAGSFADDPLFEKAMRQGAEYRRSTRMKGRTRGAKRR